MTARCSRHTVYLADRGGTKTLGRLGDLSLVRWGRERDDISTAFIRTVNPGRKCIDVYRNIEPGRHELVVYRDRERVWEGPITRKVDGDDVIEVEARDVMHYVYRTAMHAAYSSAYPNVEYVTERAERILRGELVRKESLDPPINVLPYLDVRTNDDTAKTTRKTNRYQMTAWEDIDQMAARSGLDYTVVGRSIVLWDVHDPIGTTETMTEADFLGGIKITGFGMELATSTIVTDSTGRFGVVGGIDDYYGEWEIISTSYQETSGNDDSSSAAPPTTEELRTQARRNASGRFPTPRVLRVPDNSRLDPNSKILTPKNAVPGIHVPVRATLTSVTMDQMQKLDSIRYEETGEGETISINLSPAPGAVPEEWTSTGSDD